MSTKSPFRKPLPPAKALEDEEPNVPSVPCQDYEASPLGDCIYCGYKEEDH